MSDYPRSLNRVMIGSEFDRWCGVRDRFRLKFHHEVAKLLLDSFERLEKLEETVTIDSAETDTADERTKRPSMTAKRLKLDPMPSTSRVHSTPAAKNPPPFDMSSLTEGPLSSIEPMSGVESAVDAPALSKPEQQSKPQQQASPEHSYIRIEGSPDTESESDEDVEDPTYQPSYIDRWMDGSDSEQEDIELHVIDKEPAEETLHLEDEQLGVDPPEVENVEYGTDSVHIGQATDAGSMAREEACYAYKTQLVELAKLMPPVYCTYRDCDKPVLVETSKVGTAMLIKWVCESKHESMKWSSQPRLRSGRGIFAGDFLLAVHILLSGNNYRKVALMNKFLNVGMVNPQNFHSISGKYTSQVIEKAWKQQLAENINLLPSKEVVVIGDGRMDSPGHTAQFCTYTLMEYESKMILSTVVIDKRETQLKSPNMEREGLVRALAEVQSMGLVVKELITDGHTSIAKMMREKYPQIKHQQDIWHGAKNLTKKLFKVAKSRGNKELAPWVSNVVNHFWNSSQTCEQDVDLFMAKWLGVLHHVVNEHSWALGECQHEPINQEEREELQRIGGKDAPPKWLEPDSAAHIALTRLVMDKRFLNKLHYYTNYRHTGVLEMFHNLILMYAAKRYAFSPPIYKARCLLAALDYSIHKDLPVAKKAETGEDRLMARFSKGTGIWTTVAVKVAKPYNHIPNMCTDVVAAHLASEEPLRTPRILAPEDPRRIQRTLTNVPRPSKEQMAKDKAMKSRNIP